MAEFLTPLDCEKVEGTTDEWKLTKDLVYLSDIIGEVTVPTNFTTDFASTPQIVWSLFPKDGQWDDIAVVHDWLYNQKKYPRNICDSVFLEGLKVLNIPWYQRYPMYYAVRTFGGFYYK